MYFLIKMLLWVYLKRSECLENVLNGGSVWFISHWERKKGVKLLDFPTKYLVKHWQSSDCMTTSRNMFAVHVVQYA